MTDQTYEGWAIVEIMGHRQRAGMVAMDEGPLLRIDIPIMTDGQEHTVTEFYGRAAVFSLRPCTKEIARAAIDTYCDPRPVRPVDWRSGDAALPDYSDEDEDDDDF